MSLSFAHTRTRYDLKTVLICSFIKYFTKSTRALAFSRCFNVRMYSDRTFPAPPPRTISVYKNNVDFEKEPILCPCMIYFEKHILVLRLELIFPNQKIKNRHFRFQIPINLHFDHSDSSFWFRFTRIIQPYVYVVFSIGSSVIDYAGFTRFSVVSAACFVSVKKTYETDFARRSSECSKSSRRRVLRARTVREMCSIVPRCPHKKTYGPCVFFSPRLN